LNPSEAASNICPGRGEGANILLKQDGLELAKARTDYLFHPFGELTEGEVCPTMLELDWL